MRHLSRAAFLILVHGLCGVACFGEAGGVPWEERFAQPPAEARILKIIHNWPDKSNVQDLMISTVATQGFGGVVCNDSFDQYLESEAKWVAFTRAVKAAKQAGLALWLYDERGYPSGNAGGITLRGHPEWEARGLLVATAESQGGRVALDLPPGKLVLAGAYPVHAGAIKLVEKVDLYKNIHDARLDWEAPAGDGKCWWSRRTASTKAPTPRGISMPRCLTSTC